MDDWLEIFTSTAILEALPTWILPWLSWTSSEIRQSIRNEAGKRHIILTETDVVAGRWMVSMDLPMKIFHGENILTETQNVGDELAAMNTEQLRNTLGILSTGRMLFGGDSFYAPLDVQMSLSKMISDGKLDDLSYHAHFAMYFVGLSNEAMKEYHTRAQPTVPSVEILARLFAIWCEATKHQKWQARSPLKSYKKILSREHVLSLWGNFEHKSVAAHRDLWSIMQNTLEETERNTFAVQTKQMLHVAATSLVHCIPKIEDLTPVAADMNNTDFWKIRLALENCPGEKTRAFLHSLIRAGHQSHEAFAYILESKVWQVDSTWEGAFSRYPEDKDIPFELAGFPNKATIRGILYLIGNERFFGNLSNFVMGQEEVIRIARIILEECEVENLSVSSARIAIRLFEAFADPSHPKLLAARKIVESEKQNTGNGKRHLEREGSTKRSKK